MAIFTDGQGAYFVDTFRTQKIIDDDVIGGLMEVHYDRLNKLEYVFNIFTVICGTLFIALLILLSDGWSEKISDQIVVYSLAFSSFLSIVLIFFVYTSAPQFVTVRNKTLYMVQGSFSNAVEFCITCSSMSIFILFFRMSNYYSALTFGSYYLLVLVTILFFVYFASNFYRLILVSRG